MMIKRVYDYDEQGSSLWCEKAGEKKWRVYMGFMDLEKPYNKVNREAFYGRF